MPNSLFDQNIDKLLKVTIRTGGGIGVTESWGVLKRRLASGVRTSQTLPDGTVIFDFVHFWQLDADVEVQGSLKRSSYIIESEILLVEEIDRDNFIAEREKQADAGRGSGIVSIGGLGGRA